MICEKCGKSNIKDSAICSYCGAQMPKTTDGGGFADILTYKDSPVRESDSLHKTVKFGPSDDVKGVSDLDMQKLIKKSDNIFKTTQKGVLLNLVTVGLSCLILVFSVVCMVNVSSTKKDIETLKTEMSNQIKDVKADIDAVKTEDAANDTEEITAQPKYSLMEDITDKQSSEN